MRAVRGGRIGMIFQEPATSLNPVMRVGDQIVEAVEAHTELRGDAARERALHWLRKVGIPEPERRIDDYPFRMSGGQKQRVMIALTLAAEPDFLIADEPTTALDVTIQAQILDLLRDLQREQGMGLLLITHDLAVVAGMAHRVALMYAGQIVEVAPRRRVLRAAAASLRAGAAACAARCAAARAGARGDRRHRASADAHIHRLPLQRPLRAGARGRALSTRAELLQTPGRGWCDACAMPATRHGRRAAEAVTPTPPTRGATSATDCGRSERRTPSRARGRCCCRSRT